MTRIHSLFTALLVTLLGITSLFAQTTEAPRGRIFAEVGLGYAPDFNGQIDGALGYRLANGWGIGVQYIGATSSSISVGNGFSGVGLYLGHTLWNGFYFDAGAGKIIRGTYYDDSCSSWNHDGGGTYARLGLGYRFRGGFSLGIAAYSSQNNTFDTQFRTLDDCETDPPVVTTTEDVLGYVFRLSYHFPGRNRAPLKRPAWVDPVLNRLVVDVGFGLFPGGNGQLDLGLGYRFDNGLNLTGHFLATGSRSGSATGSFSGVGINVGYALDNGVYFDGGVGKVLTARYDEDDNFDDWDHDGSGTYLRVGGGYRMPMGLSLGLSVFATQSVGFDYAVRNFETGELGTVSSVTEALPGIVLRAGWHFPSRRRLNAG